MRACRTAKPAVAVVLAAWICLGAGASMAPASEDSVFADWEEPSAPPESDPVLDLLQVLEEQTEVATRTRLNVDRVPGIVTVVYGEDAAQRGARTVFEALRLVPGVQTSVTGSGVRQVVVRGVGKVLRSGKVKLLLNGAQANATLSGEAPWLYAVPIEQVSRIEVIRGPGSAVHGEYAYVGVINVVTRKTGDEAWTRLDDDGGVTAGAMTSYESKEGGYRLSASFFGRTTDGPPVDGGLDSLAGTSNEPASNAPGPANNKEDLLGAVGTLDYKNTHLKLQLVRSRLGDFFGGANALPDPVDRTATEQRWLSLSVVHDQPLLADLDLTVEAGFSDYAEDVDFQILPSDFRAGLFDYPNGLFFGYGYPEERRYWGSGEFSYSGLDRHRLSLEVGASYVEASKFFTRTNFDPATFAPFGEKRELVGDANFLTEGETERTTVSLVAEDEITIGTWLTLTLGGRFDDYSDVGSNFSPRIAAVARLGAHHSFKAQYAEAFRPPTFIELFSSGLLFSGDPSLEPETVRTGELAYSYNTGVTVFRTSIFYAELEDSIGRGPTSFENQQDQQIHGLEVDFSREFLRYFQFEGSVSYGASDDDGTGSDFPNVATWTGNAGLRTTPRPDQTYAIEYRYLGERGRADDDPRDALGDEHTIDLTASLDRLFGSGVGLRFGVRNVLDEDVRTPAPADTYVDDFPQPGREFWGSLRYEF